MSTPITSSSLLTVPSGQWSEVDSPSSSQIENSSHTCTPRTFFQTEFKADQMENSHPEINAPRVDRQKSVDDSTVSEDAAALQAHADIDTSVLDADNLDTIRKAALSRSDMVYGMRPKYLRYNVWDHEQ
jgi:hypothetical protein